SVGLLEVGTFLAARRLTGRNLDALALAGLVLAFPEGLGALLAPHADALAAALAVLGLLVASGMRNEDKEGSGGAEGPSSPSSHSAFRIPHSTLSGAVWLAGALWALAFLTKFSSLAGPAAAVAWAART